MKEPWEVFLESFRHGAPELDLAAPWEEIRHQGNQIVAAGEKAQESLVYHLVEAEHWGLEEAKALAWEFVEATVGWMKRKDSEPDLRIESALRDQWADWVLRH